MSDNEPLTVANTDQIRLGRAADGTFTTGNPGKPPGKTFRTLAREQFEKGLAQCDVSDVVGKILYLLQNAKDERLQFDCARLMKEWTIGPDPQHIEVNQAEFAPTIQAKVQMIIKHQQEISYEPIEDNT
jgi:hypothetical protein